MKRQSGIRGLWKITYRSYRIFKREAIKFAEYLDGIPICKGRNLNKMGKIYGVNRRWWFFERDKGYRLRILLAMRGEGFIR